MPSLPLSQPLLIVVPCYNEELRLDRSAFAPFVDQHPNLHLLFVNDGSRDGTAALLEAICAERPSQLRAMHLTPNGGKAEAVRQGFLAGLAEQPGFAAIGFWDADLATPLEAIPVFAEILAARPGCEMVFGARVNLLGRQVRRKLLRHWVGRIFATFGSQLLRLAIYDTQCGAKLFRVNETLPKLFEQRFLSRWIFDVEIVARLIVLRRGTDLPQPEDVIVEHPLEIWVDRKGSKLRPRDFLTVGRDLVRIWWHYMRRAAKARESRAGEGA